MSQYRVISPSETFQIGDLVQVHPLYVTAKTRGVVYEVKAVPGGRSTKIKAARVDQPDARIEGAPTVFIGIDHEAWVGSRDEDALRATQPKAPALELGSVVKMRNPGTKHKGLFVVAWETGVDSYRLVKLGGDGQRYLRGVSGAALEVVPADEIAKHL